jgi:hypothetical protein
MLSGEWNGTPIAVVSSPGGPCAGLDATPVESLSGAAEAAWWTAAVEGLRQAVPAPAGLILVVPEAWQSSGMAGAARLESARAAFTQQGWPDFDVVSRPVAMLAWHVSDTPLESAATDCIVIFLGTDEVRATLCHVTRSAVQAVATSQRPLPAAPPEAGLLAASPPATFPTAQVPPADPRLVARRGRERLRVALAAASRNPAFLEVPVLGPADSPPDQWLTARQLRDLLAGRSQALDSVVRTVTGAPGGGIAAARPSAVAVFLTGPGCHDPLAQEEISDAVTESVPGPRPALAVPPASAAAEGAALIAAGQVTARSTPQHDYSLLMHRIIAGQAVSQSVRLTNPGNPGPLVIAGADKVACPVQVDVSGPQGTARLTVPDGESLPAGRYRAGVWPGWGGATLVLRPERGGEPALFTLSLDETRNGAGRRSTAESERTR